MNVIISGTRGEGKSTLSLWIARMFADTVVIWDPRGTFSACGIECNDVDELFDALDDKRYLPTNKSLPKPLPLVLRCDDITPAMFGDAMRRIFPSYFRFKGKIAIIIDEARELQSPHWIEPQLNRLIRQHPMDRVAIIQNTHQLMDWNSATKSVTDDVYLFRQTGPRNKKVLDEHFGSEVADVVMELPKHHIVHCWFDNRGTEKPWEVMSNPSQWNEQISETPNVRQAMPVLQTVTHR